jgi:hypothetical protein
MAGEYTEQLTNELQRLMLTMLLKVGMSEPGFEGFFGFGGRLNVTKTTESPLGTLLQIKI